MAFPVTPFTGQRVIVAGVTYEWTGLAWAIVAPLETAAISITRVPNYTISPIPPLDPQPCDLWFDNINGYEFVFYNDGSTQQWVITNAGAGAAKGPPGPPGPQGPQGPPNVNAPQTVDTAVALKALSTSKPVMVHMKGYGAAGDGGDGTYFWDPASTLAPDDGLVFQTNELPAAGRYRRMMNGQKASCKIWGAGLHPTGAVNDTAALLKALTSPYAVDLSNSVVGILEGHVTAAMKSPGLYSDGSGILVPAPTSITSSIGLYIEKGDFSLDRLTCNWPIAPYATPYPPGAVGNRPFYFRWDNNSSRRYRITNCNFVGGATVLPLVTLGVTSLISEVWIEDNFFYQVYGDCIGSYNVNRMIIARNMFMACGRDPSGNAASGNIRIGSSSQTAIDMDLIIEDNILVDGNMGAPQEVIDISGQEIMGLRLTGNVMDNSGSGGFEIKTNSTPVPIMPDTYRDILIDGNLIRLNSSVASGISLHLTGAAPPPDVEKTKQVRIANNLITQNLAPPDGAVGGVTAISVLGWSNVDIDSNTIFDVDTGIQLSAAWDSATYRIVYGLSVRGNRVESRSNSLTWIAYDCDDMRVLNNQFRATAGSNYCVSLTGGGGGANNAGVLRNLRFMGNDIWGPLIACDIRGIQGGLFLNNVIRAGTICINFNRGLSTGTIGPTTNNNVDVWIEKNHFITHPTTGQWALQLSSGDQFTIFDNTVRIPKSQRTWVAGTPGPDLTSLRVGRNTRGLLLAAGGDTVPPDHAGSEGDLLINCDLTAGGAWQYACITPGNVGGAVWKAIVNAA